MKSNLGVVKADHTQIHQVVMNLCTNALHAMEQHGGRLEVELVPTKISGTDIDSFSDIKPGEYLMLTVADTGVGMAADTLPRIFEPYFTTKEVGEGTGLGLATVHGIVKNHGGDIKVYSELGKGTTFQVLFPIIADEEKGRAASVQPLKTGHEQILLVDDEVSLVNIGKEMLEKIGYKVEALTNAPKALEAFRARPGNYDLIITDMTMPQMTGEKLAAEIKRTHPEKPVILCTGFSKALTNDSVRQMGIDSLLMKPLNLNTLATTVRLVLDQAHRAA